MGIIRGFFLVFVGILLLVALLAGNIFLTLTLSLQYDNVKSGFVSAFGDILQGDSTEFVKETGMLEEDFNLLEEIDERMETMQEHCQNETEYVFSEGEQTLVIPCNIVEQGKEAIIEKGVENALDRIYYKEYDCGFWDCFGQEEIPFFLVSKKAHDYWESKFYFVILIALALAVVAFLLVANKRNFPIVLGALILVSSIPFMKLGLYLTSSAGYAQFAKVFISESTKAFWIFFIPGIVIFAGGIALHFIKIGTSVANKIREKKAKKQDKVKEE